MKQQTLAWQPTQQGLHDFSHKVAAPGRLVVGSLGVELPAIFGHERKADEVGSGREKSVNSVSRKTSIW